MANTDHEAHAMDPEQIMARGGAPLMAAWLDRSLMEGLWDSEDDSHDERAFKLAAARAALAELAPEDSGIGEKVLAVQFLCAHAAAMAWLRRAHSPHLPEDQRDKAQRFTQQLMALTGRQLAVIVQLRDQRRRIDEAAERRGWAQEAQRTRQQIARGTAVAGELTRMARALPAGAPAASRADAGPRATTLSRQQRRALERQQRKTEQSADT